MYLQVLQKWEGWTYIKYNTIVFIINYSHFIYSDVFEWSTFKSHSLAAAFATQHIFKLSAALCVSKPNNNGSHCIKCRQSVKPCLFTVVTSFHINIMLTNICMNPCSCLMKYKLEILIQKKADKCGYI